MKIKFKKNPKKKWNSQHPRRMKKKNKELNISLKPKLKPILKIFSRQDLVCLFHPSTEKYRKQIFESK